MNGVVRFGLAVIVGLASTLAARVVLGTTYPGAQFNDYAATLVGLLTFGYGLAGAANAVLTPPVRVNVALAPRKRP